MLTCCVKVFRDSLPRSQMKSLSSIYLHQIIGFFWKLSNTFSLKSVMNRIAWRGAVFIPIVVPRFWLKVFSSSLNVILQDYFCRCCTSITWDLFVISSFQKLTKRLKIVPCGMLGQRPTTSMVQRIARSGSLFDLT